MVSSPTTISSLKEQYTALGFYKFDQFFSADELTSLRRVVLKFHEAWKKDNAEFYQEEAFNSSVITGKKYLNTDDRVFLFNFFTTEKLMKVIESIIIDKPTFMNTQLFFNPVNPKQRDFWHRDCQYDYDIEEQKQVIQEHQVLHLRLPLFDEPGMELIPGSHQRWDTKEEYDVRQEENGRKSYEALPNGEVVSLLAGDLLLFSADMLHRGVYGLDRLALDVLVFSSSPEYKDYINPECLPETDLLSKIVSPQLFLNTWALIATE